MQISSFKTFLFSCFVLIFLLSWLFHPTIVIQMTEFFIQSLFLLEKIIFIVLIMCSIIAPLVCGYYVFLQLSKKRIDVLLKQEEHRTILLANNRADNTFLLEEGQSALLSPLYQSFFKIDNRKILAPPGQIAIKEEFPQMIKLSTVLENWKPVQGQLLLGIASGMKKIIINAKEAWHIVLAGPTGGGKSNTLMLLLLQLAPHYNTYIINPHWAEVEEDGRDWRYISKRLAEQPMWKKEIYVRFFYHLLSIMETRKELKRRKDFRYVDDPMFVSIDEYPVIKDEWKDAPKIISKLLREGRKYYIFLIVSSQDLLLDTIGGNSGARECYRTAFAFDGDRTTLNIVLKDYAERKKHIDTSQLGREGKALLRSVETPDGDTIRVPFVDKDALELLFRYGIVEGSLEYIEKQDTEKLPIIEQEKHSLQSSVFSFQSSAEEVQCNKLFEDERLKTEDAIIQMFDLIPNRKATISFIVNNIKKRFPAVQISYNTDKDLICRLAAENNFMIYEGKGGPRN